MDDPANAALLGVPITVTLVGGDISGGPAVGSGGKPASTLGMGRSSGSKK